MKKVLFRLGVMSILMAPIVTAISCNVNKPDSNTLEIGVRRERVKETRRMMKKFTKKTGIKVNVKTVPESDSTQAIATNISSWYASNSAPDVFLAPADLGLISTYHLAKEVDLHKVFSDKKYFLNKQDVDISADINWGALNAFKQGDHWTGLPTSHNSRGVAISKPFIEKNKNKDIYKWVPSMTDGKKWEKVAQESQGKCTIDNITKFIQNSALKSEKVNQEKGWYGHGFSSQRQRIYSVARSCSDSLTGGRAVVFNMMDLPAGPILDLMDGKFRDKTGTIDSDAIYNAFKKDTGNGQNNNDIVTQKNSPTLYAFIKRAYYTKFGYIKEDGWSRTTTSSDVPTTAGVAESMSSGYGRIVTDMMTWQKGFIDNLQKQFGASGNEGVDAGIKNQRGLKFQDLKIIKVPFMPVGVAMIAVNRELKPGKKLDNTYKLLKYMYEKEYQDYLSQDLIPYNLKSANGQTIRENKKGNANYASLLGSGNIKIDIPNYPTQLVENKSTKGTKNGSEKKFWWGGYSNYVSGKIQQDQTSYRGLSFKEFNKKITQITKDYFNQ